MPLFLVSIREELSRTYTLRVTAETAGAAKKAALANANDPNFSLPEPDSIDYGEVSVCDVNLAQSIPVRPEAEPTEDSP